MIGWQKVQWEERVDDVRQLGGRGCNERGGRMTRGNWVVDDTKRGPRGPNTVADDTTRGGLDNARHVACNCLFHV